MYITRASHVGPVQELQSTALQIQYIDFERFYVGYLGRGTYGNQKRELSYDAKWLS